MSNESKGNGVLLGTLVGAGVGAITALLLAPKTGREMREDLSVKYSEWMAKGQELASDAKTKVADVASRVNEQTSNLVDRSKDLVSSAANSTNRALDNVKEMKEERTDQMLNSMDPSNKPMN
ncbi:MULTISPECIES: YtxH domain-containing protein [Paenibacillus]|uniref:YtxH domain-containing protein n=1 Tax=Paenibacillus TaxID=44249 RepID=UPI00020D7F8A|nr:MULTISPECIES: YtxH domain-containing protein [Paenibacillus]EGL16058.1 hypothetical protein HMPREF9413_0109 [Paenibacillus sp. HGF7]EPD80858.1 hypothetical protein HMPREF1207_04615 [Paenibacillus sp. HGH0039]MBV6714724.1 YtxH domain-containing protein [Paenibacillus chitinolyticus]